MTLTQTTNTDTLDLADYARTRSPDAFRRLVDRHLPLVYAAARRQVRDPALAEDVAQAVFLILADKAPSLRPDHPLAPWLLRVTHYAAANARRVRARQAHRERKAAEMASQRPTTDASHESDYADWSPLLDEGINRLKRGDRDAIVLRFFDQRSNREVAESLGISEPAAAKRIERAVAKLRDFFARRGATVSAAVLATTLTAHATEAAPPHVAASIGAAGAAATGVSTIAKGALLAMTYAKAKVILVSTLAGALALGGVTVVIVDALAAPDPAPSAPAAKPNPPVAGAPPIAFSDNSIATLVAIADSPDAGRWWAPDGTPLPAAPAEMPPNSNPIWLPPAHHRYYMVVRHESPALADTYLGVSVIQNHPADGNTGKGFGPNVRVIGYTVAVPDSLPAVDLRLSLARGLWAVDERYALPDGAAASPNPSRRVASVGEENGNVTITLAVTDHPTPNVPGEDQLLVVSSADGVEHSYVQASYNPGSVGAVYRFPVRKDQATTIVHRWRPYETAELRNISLRPGVKTEVSGRSTVVTPRP